MAPERLKVLRWPWERRGRRWKKKQKNKKNWRRRVAAPARPRAGSSAGGAAAAASWIFRGGESRRRRGRELDIPRGPGRVNTPPLLSYTRTNLKRIISRDAPLDRLLAGGRGRDEFHVGRLAGLLRLGAPTVRGRGASADDCGADGGGGGDQPHRVAGRRRVVASPRRTSRRLPPPSERRSGRPDRARRTRGRAAP